MIYPLKKLNKYKKNPNFELDDVVLLQKKKNTSSALKKSAKLERKNSEKELKEHGFPDKKTSPMKAPLEFDQAQFRFVKNMVNNCIQHDKEFL